MLSDELTPDKSRAQEILLKYQRLQQELLSELSQCLAHNDSVRCCQNENRTNLNEDDDNREESENYGNPSLSNDGAIESALGRRNGIPCPECPKSFKVWKSLVRHYHIRMHDLLPFVCHIVSLYCRCQML